jgi:hypothetical protein
MGSSSYSDSVYRSRLHDADTRGADVFAHTDSIAHGRTSCKAHEKLDPAKANAAGKNIRESFDSDTHPDSRSIAVMFDVTGSMSSVPRTFVRKLDKLMASLVKKGFVAHPHILFGAIGDATCDTVPLQVGQFEAGNEMDDALTNIYLEGGGGAHHTESYELAMYYLARHTDMHCLTKRGQKGYCFIMGDETPYPKVKKSEVKAVIGDDIQEDIPTEQILEELREKFEVFWVIPAQTNHWNDPRVREPLQDMFGQALLKLENPDDVCELLCSTIGVCEGYDLHDVGVALKDIGADVAAVDRSSVALTKYASTRAVAKGATTSGVLVEGGDDSVARL